MVATDGSSIVPADRPFRMRGQLSAPVIGFYVVLVVLVLAFGRGPGLAQYWYAPYAAVALFLFFLVRYLSTIYTIDRDQLRARRLLGGRSVALPTVRKIEFASLRELAPVGFTGTWGYRGRVWSPRVGPFDAVSTDSAGLLVSGDGVPLFVSPRDPAAFARELSRRARSYAGPLLVDVGAPAQPSAAPER